MPSQITVFLEKDPCEGMDEAQRLQYKRKRAEMIFTANDRGIFLACDDLNAEPLTCMFVFLSWGRT